MCDGCGLRAFALKRILHSKVEFGCVDSSGIAASCACLFASVCQAPGSRAACQDSEMTSANRIKSKWHHQTGMSREKMSGRKRPFQTNSMQPEDLSRFKDDKHKPDQETAASSDKDVESKKCQGPRLPRNHGVNGRASQAVRGRSYRLSLFFMGFSPLKLPSLGLPGLYCTLILLGVYEVQLHTKHQQTVS